MGLGICGELPTVDIRLPLVILVQMPAENIRCARRWFLGKVKQMHMYFFCLSSAFAVIAVWTCRHHVRPNVLSAHMARDHMVYRQTTIAPAAVLAGIIVATKYFAPGQLDVRAWSMHLRLQSNDRRSRQQLLYRSNVSTSIDHHVGFPRK